MSRGRDQVHWLWYLSTVCPYGALRKNDKGLVEAIAAACKGCGACGATCPEGAITMTNYTDAQLLAEARAALDEEV